MSSDIRYKVHTHWGCFSLDEASYQDYLAGKLWISWQPGKRETPKPDSELISVSAEAIALREQAQGDPFLLLQQRFAHVRFPLPYRSRMAEVSIDEMMLSVRSSNGLKRAGIDTLGTLHKRMAQEDGLLSIRNLGLKSQAEIKRCFFEYCYLALSKGEKGQFWQEVLETAGSSVFPVS